MDIVYILAWTVQIATSAPTMKIINRELDARHLPVFFLGQQGRSYVSFVGLLLSGCVLALLVWGFVHLQWYMVFVNILLGVVASVVLARLVHFVLLLYLGGFVTAGITVYLWFGR
jgi:hypothetical protein